MKKKIGIVGWRLGDNSFGVTNTYLEFAQEFGTPYILLPEHEVMDVDAVILPGGLDVNPATYGAFPAFATSSTDVFKQYFLDHRLEAYIAAEKAIFGICLGFQQLNVHFGGSLVQHLRFHEQSPSRGDKAHNVLFTKYVEDIFGDKHGKQQDVNSHHHQAVLTNTLGVNLLPLAVTKNKEVHLHNIGEKSSIVESFIHPSLPVAGVQWHPEEWFDAFSRDLFNQILYK